MSAKARITKVVIGKGMHGQDSKIIIDNYDELDGVMALTVHQDAGAPARLILQLDLNNVDIERA